MRTISRNRNRLGSMRAGLTLLELVLSTSSAALLMVGLGSAVLLSVEANTLSTAGYDGQQHRDVGLALMRTEISEAVKIGTRTTTTLSFDVPDRNADGTNETLTYHYDNTVTPNVLTRSINGSTPETVLSNLSNWSFGSLAKTVPADPTTAVISPATSPVLVSTSKAWNSSNANTITLPIAPGYAGGNDLLLCAIAIDRGHEGEVSSTGWSPLVDYAHSGDSCHLYVGYRWDNGLTGNVTFSLTDNEQACALMLRLRSVSTSSTFTAIKGLSGTGLLGVVSCPDVYTNRNNAMLIKFAALDRSGVIPQQPCSAGDLTIDSFYSSTSGGEVSLIGCYRITPTAANVSGQSFTSTNLLPSYCSCCIVIQPAMVYSRSIDMGQLPVTLSNPTVIWSDD